MKCDECKCEIKGSAEDPMLEIGVFHKNKTTEIISFCSWDCVLKYLPKIKTDWFTSLPELDYDRSKNSKRGFNHFIKLINKQQK